MNDFQILELHNVHTHFKLKRALSDPSGECENGKCIKYRTSKLSFYVSPAPFPPDALPFSCVVITLKVQSHCLTRSQLCYLRQKGKRQLKS